MILSDDSSEDEDENEELPMLSGPQVRQGFVQPKGKGNVKGIGSFVRVRSPGNRAIAKKSRAAPKVAEHNTANHAHQNTQLSLEAATEGPTTVETDRFASTLAEIKQIDDLLAKLQ